MLIIVQEQQQHSQLDSSHFAMLSPFPSPHPLAFPGSLHLILQRQNKYESLNPRLKIHVILINYPQSDWEQPQF